MACNNAELTLYQEMLTGNNVFGRINELYIRNQQDYFVPIVTIVFQERNQKIKVW